MGVDIDPNVFAEMWNNPEITQGEIAAHFYVSSTRVTTVAKRLGLKFPRPRGRRTVSQEYMPTPDEVAAAAAEIRKRNMANYRDPACFPNQKGRPTRVARVCYAYDLSRSVFIGFDSAADAF